MATITVGELISQLRECPEGALVDVSLEYSLQVCCGHQPATMAIQADENLSVLRFPNHGPDGTAWVTLRGVE